MQILSLTTIDETAIHHALAEHRFMWIDLESPGSADLARLQGLFQLHPLAIEDAEKFGQRPKFEQYETHDFLVFYGVEQVAADVAHALEVHVFVHGSALITVRRDDITAFTDVRARLTGEDVRSQSFVIHAVLDALTDSFFPIVAAFDDLIDTLEDDIVEAIEPDQQERIFHLKRQIVRLRRIASAQRDTMMRAAERIADVPALTADSRVYLRDVVDHTMRINDSLDAARDLLVSLVELYQSAVANRQNAQMQQLTLVATVFLPLMFLTGFFGQNFGWMVGHLDSRLAFLGWGLGASALSALGIIVWLRVRRYW